VESYSAIRAAVQTLAENHPDWTFIVALNDSWTQLEEILGNALQTFFDAALESLEAQGLLIADGTMAVVGDDGVQLMVGYGNGELYAEDGDDYIVHFGSGRVDGGSGDDLIVGILPDYLPAHQDPSDPEVIVPESRLVVDGGANNDSIYIIGGDGAVVHGGSGDDTILNWSFAGETYGGDGADTFWWSPDTLIADGEADDRLELFGIPMHGGTAFGGEDVQWARNILLPFVKYGLNSVGELVVNFNGENMYVADYQGGPYVTDPTLGITVVRVEWEFRQLLKKGSLEGSPLADVLRHIFKGMGILPPEDPLVLDLDGDGLEFTTLGQSLVHFDLDGDFFAEKTGWLRSDDGFLALDRDGNGLIDDVSELFGAPGVSGFTELAALDSNSDGVIDAADTDFALLQVWRDFDGDGASDAGELATLAEAGIASISLATTAIDVTTSTDHHLSAQATFTRSDATTGDIYQAELDASQTKTVYLGDSRVPDWAEGLADVKGYGILTGLRLAASNDFAVAEALETALAAMTAPDLAALVAAAEPLLAAWAAGSPTSRELTPVLVITDANGTTRLDHGIYEEDGSGGFWRLASGADVLDAGSNVIARPTLEDVLAQAVGSGEAWRLEQAWSPGRDAALADREAAPYLLDADGSVLDYGIWQGTYWTLASGADVLDGSGAVIAQPTLEDVLAQAVGAGQAWQVESFAAPEAAALADGLAVFYDGDTVVDYAVYVDDPAGGYWASALAVEAAVTAGSGTVSGATNADLAAFAAQHLLDLGAGADRVELVEGALAAFAAKSGGADLADLTTLIATLDGGGLLVYGEDLAEQRDFLGALVERYVFWREAVAVRLAAQGPLAGFFQEVTYDAEPDLFLPAGGRELIPLFEAIFAAAPGDAQGDLAYLEQWHPIVAVVYADYKRHNGGEMTEGFVFANLVAAWESTGLAAELVEAAEALGLSPADIFDDATGGATLAGTSGTDIFYLAGQDQTAMGGQGIDTYVLGQDFGQAVIDDSEAPLSNRGPDVLRFADTASSEVTARREGIDLILTVDASGDTVTLSRQFLGRLPGLFGGDANDDTGVAEIVFADGVAWDELDIAYAVSHPQATDDTVEGTPDIDVLEGGAGNDTLKGGADSDLYLFNAGDGQDVINDLNGVITLEHMDIVKFGPGIAFEDTILSRDGSSETLVITFAGSSDSVTVQGQFAATYTGPLGVEWLSRIELFTFDDGLHYSWEDIMRSLVAEARTDGDDTIYGFDYEDRLDGGLGNDFLSGGNESDTYVFALGYGNDTIHDDLTNILSGQSDRLLLGEGITLGDLAFAREGDSNHLVISVGAGGDTVTLQGQFYAVDTGVFGVQRFHLIETLEFADGATLGWQEIQETLLDQARTAGDDTIYGFFGQDTLDGGQGDDSLMGGEDGDSYLWDAGQGSDTIHDVKTVVLADAPDRVVFGPGLAPGDLALARDGTDLVFTVTATGETLRVEQQFATNTLGARFDEVETFELDDTTVWERADVLAGGSRCRIGSRLDRGGPVPSWESRLGSGAIPACRQCNKGCRLVTGRDNHHGQPPYHQNVWLPRGLRAVLASQVCDAVPVIHTAVRPPYAAFRPSRMAGLVASFRLFGSLRPKKGSRANYP